MSVSGNSGVAIVTGGSGGIGSAVAAQLAQAGIGVAVTYNRNRATAEKLIANISRPGVAAHAVQLDLRDGAEVHEVFEKLATQFNGIRALITAHGPFIKMVHISKLEPSLLRETMEADTMAAYNAIHAAIPHLRKTKGSIVAMATAAIRRYAATDILSVLPKAAIEALIHGVAVEEGRYGVRANTVGVGLLEDGMFHALKEAGSFTEEFLAISRKNIPMKRFGSAAEIAEAVCFLASERASYITGQTLMVDGGYAV